VNVLSDNHYQYYRTNLAVWKLVQWNDEFRSVIPAEAGIQDFSYGFWIPVFTGMT